MRSREYVQLRAWTDRTQRIQSTTDSKAADGATAIDPSNFVHGWGARALLLVPFSTDAEADAATAPPLPPKHCGQQDSASQQFGPALLDVKSAAATTVDPSLGPNANSVESNRAEHTSAHARPFPAADWWRNPSAISAGPAALSTASSFFSSIFASSSSPADRSSCESITAAAPAVRQCQCFCSPQQSTNDAIAASSNDDDAKASAHAITDDHGGAGNAI